MKLEICILIDTGDEDASEEEVVEGVKECLRFCPYETTITSTEQV